VRHTIIDGTRAALERRTSPSPIPCRTGGGTVMAIDDSIPPTCACGCGQTVPRQQYSRRKTLGLWAKWVHGHNTRHRNPAIRKEVVARYRARTINGVTKRVHVLRAEAALGRPLPSGAQVHHADGSFNETAPLVICQDRYYHYLLHARMRIVRAGGDPDNDSWCSACRRPRPRSDFYVRKTTSGQKAAGKLTTVCRLCSRERSKRQAR
jgi:hypothetical protein